MIINWMAFEIFKMLAEFIAARSEIYTLKMSDKIQNEISRDEMC